MHEMFSNQFTLLHALRANVCVDCSGTPIETIVGLGQHEALLVRCITGLL